MILLDTHVAVWAADRLIVATARYWRAPLLTSDRAILDYATDGHMQAMTRLGSPRTEPVARGSGRGFRFS